MKTAMARTVAHMCVCMHACVCMCVGEYVCVYLFGRYILGSVLEVLFVFEETCLSLRLQSESLISGNSLLPGLTFTPLFS